MLFSGRVDGYAVEKAVPIPGEQDALVLLVYDADGAPERFPNVLRIAPDGRVVWRAAPPETSDLDPSMVQVLHDGDPDVWVALGWRKRSRQPSANSWSCFYCELDPESGRITSALFTK